MAVLEAPPELEQNPIEIDDVVVVIQGLSDAQNFRPVASVYNLTAGGDFDADARVRLGKGLKGIYPFNQFDLGLETAFGTRWLPSLPPDFRQDDSVTIATPDDARVSDLASLITRPAGRTAKGSALQNYLLVGETALSFIESSLSQVDTYGDGETTMTRDDAIALRLIQLAYISGVEIEPNEQHLIRVSSTLIIETLANRGGALIEKGEWLRSNAPWLKNCRRTLRSYGMGREKVAERIRVLAGKIEEIVGNKNNPNEPAILPLSNAENAAMVGDCLTAETA